MDDEIALPEDDALAQGVVEAIDTACDLPGEFVARVSTETPADPAEAAAFAVPVNLAGSDPPPEVAESALLTALESIRAELSNKLDQVASRLDRESRAEETREKVVDRLHAELQEYKNDLLLRLMKPVFLDLIQLHDDLGKRADSVGDPAVRPILEDYQQAIEDILYRQGVEPFQLDPGPFDPRMQRAVSTVPTDDPDANKHVATRVRKGFLAGAKVIRPEMVMVYSHKK
jgi:molecular chaperone GrpE